MPAYYSASQAAARLGISRQTLYSYVSRGLLRTYPGDSHRERRYRIAEVDQLAIQRSHARSPIRAARDSLNWGLPVVESSICCIDAGHLFYRGKNVLSLIETHSAEDIAALLWQYPKEEIFVRDAPSGAKIPAWRPDPNNAGSLTSAFAMATRDLPTDFLQTLRGSEPRRYGDLVRILAGCVFRAPATAQSVRQQCAAAWKLGAKKSRLIEAAMILCADHELNASSFTVRCVASTAASLHACVLAGLAALSGPYHGGMTAQIESLWDEMDQATNPEEVLRVRLARGGYLPGFGHRLYPEGDIRASAILERLGGKQRWRPLAQAVENVTGQRPSLDFALVALRRQLGLPAGTALGIFSLGRSIGWIAHAIEQRSEATLIRPRAAYRGPPPEHQG